MPDNRNKIRILAISAVSVAVLAAMGIAAVGSAQDTDITTEDTPQTVQSVNRATLVRIQATDANAAAVDAAAAAPATLNRQTAASVTAKRPPNMLLRRPQAPAKVQWSSAKNRANQMKSARRPNSLAARLPKQTLDKTRLPVLLPREGVIATDKARMVSFGDAYALNMPQAKGMQVTMYGNRTFVAGNKGAVSARPVQKLAGVVEDVRITQMEDGWTATFTRYGVVYSLDVTCDDIKAPDCVTDGYIRQAIAQFDDVTLGAQAEAEANKDAGPSGWLDSVSKTISNITRGGQS